MEIEYFVENDTEPFVNTRFEDGTGGDEHMCFVIIDAANRYLSRNIYAKRYNARHEMLPPIWTFKRNKRNASPERRV